MNYLDSNDVQIEAIVPKQLSTPEKKHGANTIARLAVRLSNNSSTPLRFNFYSRTLLPELQQTNGQIKERGYFRRRRKVPTFEHFPWVEAKESIDFPVMGVIYWYERPPGSTSEQFNFHIVAEDGGHWYFRELNWEEYQIRFTYRNLIAIFDSDRWQRYVGRIEGLWVGEISTFLVTFSLKSTLLEIN